MPKVIRSHNLPVHALCERYMQFNFVTLDLIAKA